MPDRERTLLLWRHAKSAWDNPDVPDIARPLAPRGERAATLMAAWIASQYQPDAIICSPARRASETYAAIRGADLAPTCFDRRVYEAAWPVLLSVLQETGPAIRTLLLIGHNPGLADLTAALAGAMPGKFPTGACAVLRFSGDWADLLPGRSTLTAFQRPKALQPT